MRFVVALILTVAASGPSHGYELDYGVDDYFLLEAADSGSQRIETQVWDLTIRRGLVKGKEQFIDFDLVVFHLASTTSATFALRGVDVYRADPELREVRFVSGAVLAEFGAVQKLFVKVQFNEDGSIADISGSTVDPLHPEKAVTYRLIREQRKVEVGLRNKIAEKEYVYSPRRVGSRR